MVARGSRQIEVEWQLAVRDVDVVERALRRSPPVAPWSLRPAPTIGIRDVYLDTEDWRLWQTGYALRVRRSGDRVEATLKAVRRPRGGVAHRREISEALRDARIATLRATRGPVGIRLRRAMATGSTLRRLFALRTRRRRLVLFHDGRAVAELALDRTHIRVPGGRSRRLERLEVEVIAGSPIVVARFVATLRRARHLKLAGRSKFEEGLAAAGLVPPPRR